MCSLIFVLFLSIFWAKNAKAHVTEVYGTISVELHVDPGDAPIAGSESILEFEVFDIQNRFVYSKCDCTLSILKDGKQIQSISLPRNDDDNYIKYIFPSKGDYQLKLTGKPDNESIFQFFEVTYPVSVTREIKHYPDIKLLSVVIVTVVAAVFLILKRRTKK